MLFDQAPLQKGSTPPPPEEGKSRALRNVWIIFGVVVVVLLIYNGLIFYSRREENLEIQRQAAERQRESDARSLEMMGGNQFQILMFYASPGHLHRGDTANLCYGTSNAKSVTLDPKVADVYPAYSNCVRVSPRKTTTYTLTATDAQGHSKTESLTLEVH
jgi:hypothetical protein